MLQKYNKPEKILNQFWDYGLLPIDPYLISSRMGLTFSISYRTGVIQDKTIYLNPLNSSLRNRFIAAHLLGHYVLHDGNFTEKSYNFTTKVIDIKEMGANAFALELLMPSKYVRKIVQKYTNFEEICNIFQVSQLAMDIRLRQLKLI